ncbi:MAG: tyrosine-type recombinase/integrase, partial [Romboutsia sp.]
MRNLQEIKSNKQSKYDEIIEYLSQDNGYWLEHDKWDLTKDFFMGKVVYSYRNIDFSLFENQYLKNELKYYIIYSFKENLLKDKYIVRLKTTFKHFSKFLNDNYKECNTFSNCERYSFELKFKNYLLDNGFSLNNNIISSQEMNGIIYVLDFINDFYDDREETEKDIWYSKNIKGAKLPASGSSSTNYNSVNFTTIPLYYRETVKRYFRTIITKKSWMTCHNTLKYLSYFFNYLYSNKYRDECIENLNRNDIEKYLYYVSNDRKDK